MHRLFGKLVVFSVLAVIGGLVAPVLAGSDVKVWEEDLPIPTWLLGPPEANPTFAWSSSRQEVYPYPYKELLTDQREMKTYRACWLENEYIKVLVLPEIGGRLHGAVDKTNNYNFFYWQPTIKPALVGMTGAWISGGIEWNFPHGHRPTGFSPVQYRLVENPDGSKTVWVGEPELVHRMRWIVGLTVYPGKSIIEAKVVLFNSSPIRHSFQMWTTTAVNANDDYQAIFPTRLMTGHGKVEYWHWPVDNGVDISWWKNVPNAASFFAEERGSYFGGYDHGKNAGTVIVGNPDIVIGKKFWTWGTSPSGRIWEPILTEDQGPYLEPQAGAYSDNQPDYHWIEPGEVKSYSHFFYPIRDIGPFKIANLEGALNLEPVEGGLRVGAYATSARKGAVLRLSRGSEVVFEKPLDLDPAAPFSETVPVPGNREQLEALTLRLISSDGAELLSYTPTKQNEVELPEPAPPFDDPAKITSADELWHAGDYLYKFRDPDKGRLYFEEAVRRDPLDTRANVSLAELKIKGLRFEEALEHLDNAVRRDQDNGRIFYLRALAEEALDRYDDAYSHYYRAVHFEDYLSRAYERLAMIDLRRGDPAEAVRKARLAVDKNALNPRLHALLATALRKNGDREAAAAAAEKALALDPLDAWAANEVALSAADGSGIQLVNHLLHDSRTAIEFALNYANAGLYDEAYALLDLVEADALILYYKGYCKASAGDAEAAGKLFAAGARTTVDYAFAFRPEGLKVFHKSLDLNPDDGRAHYYLGLIYAKAGDLDRAVTSWKESTRLDPRNARAWRDIGLALARGEGKGEDEPEGAPQDQARTREALESYEKAFELAPSDTRILLELDQIKQALKVEPAERMAFFSQHLETVKQRDALIGTLVDLLLMEGKAEEALSYLESNHFNSWEGGYSIHNAYMEAHVALARAAVEPKIALSHYQKACEYPMNLEVAPREPNWRGFLYVPMARLHRELGDEAKAAELLGIAAGEKSEYPTLGTYYRAQALKELGRDSEADEAIAALEKEAKLILAGESENYLRTAEDSRQALAHFYLAKVAEMRGDGAGAAKETAAARELRPKVEREAVMRAQVVFARAHQ